MTFEYPAEVVYERMRQQRQFIQDLKDLAQEFEEPADNEAYQECARRLREVIGDRVGNE